MKPIVLWVDDIRQPDTSFYDSSVYEIVSVKSVNDAIEMIKKNKQIKIIDVDHDAGEFFKDGGDFIKILDYCEEHEISFIWRIHSANPVGRQNMQRIIQKNKWPML